jgi:hypothetical protein
MKNHIALTINEFLNEGKKKSTENSMKLVDDFFQSNKL